jgi:hypothetical protein
MSFDLRPQVEKILRDNNCFPFEVLEGGIQLWRSPRVDTPVQVPPVVRSEISANEIMKQAGLAAVFKWR